MLNVGALRQYMKRSKVTGKQLSELWQVNQPCSSMKLSGARGMSLTEIMQLATLLKLTKEEFVEVFGEVEAVEEGQNFRKFWRKL